MLGLGSASISKAESAERMRQVVVGEAAAEAAPMVSVVEMAGLLPGTYLLFTKLDSAACPVSVQISAAGQFTTGDGLTNAAKAANIAEIKHADLKVGGAQCEGNGQVLLFDSLAGAEPMLSGDQLEQFSEVGEAFFASGADAVTKTCGPFAPRTNAYFFSNTMQSSQPSLAAANLIAEDIIPANDVIYMLMTEAFGGDGLADACWYVQKEPVVLAVEVEEPEEEVEEVVEEEGVVPIPGADEPVEVAEHVIEPPADDGAEEFFPTPIPDDAVCFPGTAVVSLESGEKMSMNSLSIGDRVLVGNGEYSEVFMFTHKLADVEHDFVSLSTESEQTITATAGHYIPVVGKGLVAARAIEVGDHLFTADGLSSAVLQMKMVRGTGLFNPQTLAGDIVVDSIVASTYTMAVDPPLAHAVLALMRTAFRLFGLSTGALESGSPLLAGLAPSGDIVASF